MTIPSVFKRRPAASLTLAFLMYVASYSIASRIGMQESLHADSGDLVWAFSGVRQRLDIILDSSNPEAEYERSLYFIFFPLICFDRTLGHIHVYSGDLPVVGG